MDQQNVVILDKKGTHQLGTKAQFPAGTYYIGDLCYNKTIDWEEFCRLTIEDQECYDGIFQLKDGRFLATYGTAYGDGTYYDNWGRAYWVDAGLIGIIPCEEGTEIEGGLVRTFSEPFIVKGGNGVMHFGPIRIDTKGEPSDED
jgi:hypothetical protein